MPGIGMGVGELQPHLRVPLGDLALLSSSVESLPWGLALGNQARAGITADAAGRWKSCFLYLENTTLAVAFYFRKTIPLFCFQSLSITQAFHIHIHIGCSI